MRSKEEAHDYRYFPDPDLLPVVLTDEWIKELKDNMIELPTAKKERFMTELELNEDEATVLTSDKNLADYYEEALDNCHHPRLVSSWVLSELLGALNKENLAVNQSPIGAKQLSELLNYIVGKTISGKMAKDVFQQLWQDSTTTAGQIIKQQGLKQIQDMDLLEKIIEQVMQANPEQLKQYQQGREKLFSYFVGQVMRATKGQASPQKVNELLRKQLSKL